MAAEQPTTYTVLVSPDGGTTWEVSRSPFKAANGEAAIRRVRNENPDFKADTSLQFLAIANMRPRKMQREIIEKWSLGYADAEPAEAPTVEQGTLSDG